MSHRCIAILGGSFDPVHIGHVALARYFVDVLNPDELRILPAGNPWQKHGLQASGADRLAMLKLAFNDIGVPIVFDDRELTNTRATVTIASLQSLRSELGNDVSLAFLMGADQLEHLDTWQQWRGLFEYANLCAAARPGFVLAGPAIPLAVSTEFARRAATPEQLRSTAHGTSFLAPDLAVDISATAIRSALHHGRDAELLLLPAVLDYIQQHHLYKN